MKKTVFFLLVILFGSFTHIEGKNDDDYVLFSAKIDDSWISLIISNSNYNFTDENSYSRMVEFLYSPWDWINDMVEKTNFFSTIIKEPNPHTIIEIKIDGKINRQEIGHINIQPEPLPLIFYSIIDRITGRNGKTMVWPFDLSISIMESFPEQYGVSVKFLRTNDLLDMVVEEEVSLLVSTSTIESEDFTSSVLIKQDKHVEIPSGGGEQTILFDTFTVGVDHSPSQLVYTIAMENGMYLTFNENTTLPILSYREDIIDILSSITQLSNVTGDNTLQVFPFFFWIGLMLIPLARKFKHKGKSSFQNKK